MGCGRSLSWDTRFKSQDRPPHTPPPTSGVTGAPSLPLPTESFPPLESPSFLSPLTAPLPLSDPSPVCPLAFLQSLLQGKLVLSRALLRQGLKPAASLPSAHPS